MELNTREIQFSKNKTHVLLLRKAFLVLIFVANNFVTFSQGNFVYFNYSQNTYCTSSINPTPIIFAPGGVFSSTTGISLNPSTGYIDLGASSQGTYIVTYTLSGISFSNKVTLSAGTGAGFSYAATTFCTSDTNPQATISGVANGIFSSSTGLLINPNSGAINLSASTAGSYDVIYTPPSNYNQFGVDIDGGSVDDRFGFSTTFNKAGDIMAVGAPLDDSNGSNSGQVSLYKWNGFVWIQQGNPILGESAGDNFGDDVSLNAAGDRLIVGATQNDGGGSNSGHVRVYTYNNNNWTQLGQDIDGESANDRFGWSVDINAKGDRIVAGASYNDGNGGNSGQVRIFELINGLWAQLGTDIDGEVPGDQFGSSVAMNDVGDKVVAGGRYNDGFANDAGHVRVYTYNAGNWNQIGADINGRAANIYFGYSVDMNAAGDKIVASAPWDYSQRGLTRVYSYSGGTWSQLGQDILGEANTDYSGSGEGSGLSMNDLGDKIVIGAYQNDGGGSQSGHTRVYGLESGSWSQLGFDLNGEAANDYSGWSVAINGAGDRVSSGAIYNDGGGSNAGHVRVYEVPVICPLPLSIVLEQEEDPSFSYSASSYCSIESDPTPVITGTTGGVFSSTTGLSINSATGVIDLSASTPGSYGVTYTTSGLTSGSCVGTMTQSVRVSATTTDFSYAATTFCVTDTNPQATISGVANGIFSSSTGLLINPNSGAINLSASTAGSYDVIYTPPSNYNQFGVDIDGTTRDDYFGWSTALNKAGDIMASGGILDDARGTNSGAVKVYKWSGTAWVQHGNEIKGESSSDEFGNDVALNAAGDRLIVGARYNDGGGSNSGHVRIYHYDNGVWTQLGQDINGESSDDRFGWSVDINAKGDRIVAGAINDDGNGSNAGHVRIYELTNGSWVQLGADIDGEFADDQLGFSVAMNDLGNRIIAGSRHNDGRGSNSGHVRVFEYASGSWGQLGSDIDGRTANIYFGYSVDMNAAGDKIVASAPWDYSQRGLTRVYSYSGGTWSQLGQDILGEANTDYSGSGEGSGLSMNDLGDKIVIGAYQNDGGGSQSGHTRVYGLESGSWSQLGFDLNGEAANDYSGWSVAINGAGDRVSSGAIYNDGGGSNAGHVRVYEVPVICPLPLSIVLEQEEDPSFSYSASSYCSIESDPTPVITGTTGGVFSSTTGLSINSATGVIDLSASTPGSYGVTYTTSGLTSGSCVGTMTQSVRVSATTTDFSYAATTFCVTDTNPQATISGVANGIFSSSTGLLINPNSGAINLSASTAGSYDVIYTPPSNYNQFGVDIDGTTRDDYFGWSTALNKAGDIMASGGILDDARGTNSGAVKVYKWSGTAWVQHGNEIKGESSSDEFGNDVALNAAGDRLIVGARYNDGGGSNSGHVRIYHYDNGVWTQLGQDINGESSDDRFGWSVDINAKGDRIVAGAINDDGNGSNAGHVRIYELTNGSWVQLGADIDGEFAGDQLGFSVAMNDLGNRIIAGARHNDGRGSNSGHVRVFEYASGSWGQLGSDIDGRTANIYFGYSVDMNAAGDKIVASAPWDYSQRGLTRVYSYSGGTWSQLGQDILGEANTDYSGSGEGSGLSMNDLGDKIVIGAYQNDGGGSQSGHTRVYGLESGSWSQLGFDLNGEAANDYSGWSVAINGAGDRVSSGAIYNDGGGSNAGHVRVYEVPVICPLPLSIVLEQEEDPSFSYSASSYCSIESDPTPVITGTTGGVFSSTTGLSINSATGVIDLSASTPGSYGVTYTTSGSTSGSCVGTMTQSVRVSATTTDFSYAATTFCVTDTNPQATISGVANGIFSSSTGLLINPNSGAINLSASTAGSYDVIYTPPSNYNQFGVDIDGTTRDDYFGWSTALNKAGDIMASGGILDDARGSNSGAVKVYKWSGTAWVQHGNEIAGESSDDRFGWDVALNAAGDRLIVGAQLNDGGGSNSGHVRIYHYDNGVWTQLGQDINGESSDDRFGWSVDINAKGDRIVAGAIYDDGNGSNAGHVRIYELTNGSWVQLGADIDGEFADDQLGFSVAMNDLGNRIIAGSRHNDGRGSNSGHVRVFEYASGSWGQLGSDIDGRTANIYFGYSVDMNAAGDKIVASAPWDYSQRGLTRVYSYSGGTWSQLGQDILGEANADYSGSGEGSGLSMNDLGDKIVIGARTNDGRGSNSGHTRVYGLESGSWSQLGFDLNGEAANDHSGWSVAINGAGDRVSSGAIYNDGGGSNAGHVRVYEVPVICPLPLSIVLEQEEDPSFSYSASSYCSIESDPTPVITGTTGGVFSSTTGLSINSATGVIDLSASTPGSYGVTYTTSGSTSGSCVGTMTQSVRVSATTTDFSYAATTFCVTDTNPQATISGVANGIFSSSTGLLINPNSGAINLSASTAGSYDVIYTPPSNYNQFGVDIDGTTRDDYFGWSTALNKAGDIMASGAQLDDARGSNSGAVKVYKWSGTAWVQHGNEIAGESSDDRFGWDVALNAAGDRLIVGAQLNDGGGSNSGHVRIYHYDNGVWTQLGQDINGESSDDRFGWSVDINAKGDRIVAGAIYDDGNGSNAGHVRIYELTNGSWVQLGADIDGEFADDQLGFSVAMNDLGNRIIAGSRHNDGRGSNSGHVRVFEYASGSWGQLGSDIDGRTANIYFGYSVDMNAAGDKIVASAPWDYSQRGLTRVYSYSGGTWSQLGQDILGEANADYSGSGEGSGLSMNDLGDKIVIGARTNDGRGSNSGHTRVYGLESGSWSQLGFDLNGEAANDHSGWSVAINGAGDRVSSGAIYNDGGGSNAGHVRVYEVLVICPLPLSIVLEQEEDPSFSYSASSYCSIESDPTPVITGTTGGVFSSTTGLSINSATGVIDLSASTPGSYGVTYTTSGSTSGSCVGTMTQSVRVSATTTDFSYAATTFCSNATNPVPTITGTPGGVFSSTNGLSIDSLNGTIDLLASTAGNYDVNYTLPSNYNQFGVDIDGTTRDDYFGWSTALNKAGDIMASGAQLDDARGSNSGAVKVYKWSGTAWVQHGNEIAGESSDDRFGWDVALNAAGDRLIVGAQLNDGGGSNSGHVRIYHYDNGVWTQLGQDINGESSDDRFGWSVDINAKGDRIVAGAIYDDGNGSNAGHVRIYELTNGSWVQLGADIDGQVVNDQFGGSIAMNDLGNRVAVGAKNSNGYGTNSGHVRVFEYASGSWSQLGRDINGRAANIYFGYSVDMNAAGDKIVASAPWDYSQRGLTRVYSYSGGTWSQLGQDILGEANADYSGSGEGSGLSMNDLGDKIVIGAYQNDGGGSNSGHTRVYEIIAGSWYQTSQDLNGEAANDHSGWSVAINGAGDRVASGAIYNDGGGSNAGHVRVYEGSDLCSQPFSISISPSTLASIDYQSVSYCRTETDPTPVITGSAGGVFSSSSGLSINSTTGEVDLSSSSLGVYYISYNLNANSCGPASVTKDTIEISQSSSSIQTITSCDSYTWIDNKTYTASNTTATYTLTNQGGCDSLITLDLTINKSPTIGDTITTCNSYTWVNGLQYSSTGTYYDTIPSLSGCDTLRVLELNIDNIDVQNLSVSNRNICAGSSTLITTSSSEIGVSYTLKNLISGIIISGPVAGTGSGLTFNTGVISTSTNFYVYAEKNSPIGSGICFANTNSVAVNVQSAQFKLSKDTLISCGIDSVQLDALVGYTSYLWSNNDNSQKTYVSSSGMYYITVTSSNGCFAKDSIYVSLINAKINQSDTAVCNGTALNIGVINSSAGSNLQTLQYKWTSGATTSSINVSPTQTTTYYVTVTDGVGSCVDSVIINVLEGSTVKTNVSCNGGNDGSATASGTGGTTPYSYLWSNAAATASITGVAAGTYTVTITDANNCTSVASTTITEPLVLSASAVNTAVSCNGGSDGSATASGTGGTTPYSYLWSNAATTASITGVAAGTYTVTITDANSCTNTSSVTITEPTALVASSVVNTAVSCNGGSDGSATASVTGGTTPYSYLWSNAATTASITGLTAGTYTVTVTDGNACTITSIATITEPTALVASSLVNTNASCNGGNGGSATASGTGGTTPYSYLWSNAAATASITGVAAGTYTVTVSDANNCTTTSSLTITAPAPVTASIVSNNISCNGLIDGSATASVTGGTTPYSYLWSNAAATASITGVAAGTYTVTITDANNCTSVASTTITEPLVLSASAVNTAVSCNGGSDGSATASGTGGTTPYSYLWSNAAATASITGVAAGTYTVTITDANNCTSVASTTITEPLVLSASAVNTAVSCNGGSDGSATASGTGGTTPYSYLWSNAATTASITGVAAGTYTVTITDANSCTNTSSVTITEPTALVASSVVNTAVSCNGGSDGSATASVTGGTTPYSYLWSNAATTASITGLTAGTYTVTVTDGNACTTTLSLTITAPASVTASIVSNNISCNGLIDGSATASGTGGTTPYSYLWSNAAATASITGVAAGTYTVTITDANSCTNTSSVTITEPTALVASSVVNTAVSCNGGSDGSATASVTGGTTPYSYLWSNAAATASITGVVAGTYTVTISDANNCTTTSSVTIVEPTALVASSVVNTAVSCNGGSDGSATASGTGGTTPYSYLWSNAAATASITGVAAGTYTVTISDANNCTTTSSVTIAEPTALVASSVVNTAVSCNGGSDGSATASVTGGTTPYSYLWSNAAATASITGVAAGTYTVTITDANNCTSVASTTITEPLVLSASAVNTAVSCNGGSDGSATASGTGGTTPYSYLWSNAAATASITGVAAGTYTVTITDANNCTSVASTTITEPLVLSASAVNTAVSCNGGSDGSATASGTGGTTPYSYLWSNAATTASITGVAAGTYTVTITDANSCTNTSSVTITEPTALVASSVVNTAVSCNGGSDGSATASVTGGTTPYSYLWSNAATTASITGLTAGTYTVTVTDGNACTTTLSLTITAPASVTASIVSNNISCNGLIDGSATASGTGGTTPYSYLWSNAAATASITGVAAGTYTVTITDANSCTNTSSVTITEPTALVASSVVNTAVSCNGGSDGSATASVTGGTTPYSYLWSNAAATASITGVVAGTYTVTISDANNCTTTSSVTIVEPTALVASSVVNTAVSCNGGSDGSATASGTGGTTPYSYLWSNAAATASITGVAAGTYTVTISDANNCTTTSSVTITQPIVLSASTAANTNVSCNGGSDGSATASGTGGTTPYSYLWSNAATTASITGVAAGTYTVTVTDANSCTSTSSVTITQPIVLSASTAANTNVSCNGGSDGSATASGTGGTTPYSYLWSNAATTASITGVAAGTYTVTVSDANSCTTTSSVTITEPTLLVSSIQVNQNVTIFGTNDGSVTASGSGGTLPYTYLWNTTARTATINNLFSGVYTVTITDGNNCTSSKQVTVFEPGSIRASMRLDSNVTCSGGINGGVGVSVTGGVKPYSFLWSNSLTDSTITGLSAGTYTVTVRDANGGIAVNDTTVTEPAQLFATSNVINNASCAGVNDGAAQVSVTGGTLPYSFIWSNTATATAINNILAGVYSVTITDSNSCMAIVTVNVLNNDTVAPAILTQPITVYLDASGQATITASDLDNGTADNCQLAGIVIDSSSFDCNEVGLNTVNFKAVDASGNRDSVNVTITVIDSIKPIISTLPITVYLDANGQATITATDLDNGTSDNCQVASIAIDSSNFDCSEVGANTLVFSAIDVNNNTSTSNVTVTVIDSIKPVVATQPLTVYLDASGQATITASDLDNGTADNCQLAGIVIDSSNFDCSEVGLNTVNFKAIDASGNRDSVNVTVTVIDSIKPIIATQPITVYLDASGQATITASDLDNGTADNCQLAGIVIDSSSFDCNEVGLNTVNFKAVDASGNRDSVNVTITVIDSIKPIISTLPITVYLDANGQATITATDLDNGTSDNCQVASIAIDSSNFDCSEVGANTLVFSAIDVNNNTSTSNVTVTVIDSIKPVVATQPLTVYLDASGQATITASDLDNGTADNCQLAGIVIDSSNFDCSEVGLNTVNFKAIDASGNRDSVNVTVTVIDSIKPIIATQPITVYLDASGQATITASDLDNGTADNCQLAGIVIDSSSFDCNEVGLNTVNFKAVDASGNRDSVNVTITVIDSIKPIISTLPITVYLDANGQATITATDLDNGTSDNCQVASIAIDSSNFDCSEVGANTLVFSAIDVNNNTSTSNVTVTVIDSIKPVVATQPLTVYLDASGQATITASDLDNGTADNCQLAGIVIDSSNFDCSEVGLNTVNFKAIDASGNRDSVNVTVTVIDSIKPIIATQPITVYLDASGQATITASDLDNGTADNCQLAGIAIDSATFDVTELGSNNVWFTAIDVNANGDSTIEVVTVLDTIAPMVSNCPINIVVSSAINSCDAAVTWVAPTASDNGQLDSLISSHVSGSTFPSGTTIITYIAYDQSMNTDTCSFMITVLDSVAPIITNTPSNITVSNDAGQCGAVVSWTLPIATDNCQLDSLVSSYSVGTLFAVGTTTVTYIAYDVAMNTDTISFTVTVIDTEKPTIICIADTTICGGVYTYAAPTTTDNCGVASVVRTAGLPSGSTFPPGSTLITYLVTDIHGNVDSCSFTVTRDELPTLAAVGVDYNVCSDTVILNGNNPLVGAGTWSSLTSGTTILLPSDSASRAVLQRGANTLVWTISSGVCAISSDTITITYDSEPTIASAGPDQTLCDERRTTMEANIPQIGKGVWSLLSGSGNLSNINNSKTTITGLSDGVNELLWTISNGECATSIDTITLTGANNPVLTMISDTTIFKQDGVRLFVISDILTKMQYSWSPMFSLDNSLSQTPFARPDEDTRYSVRVTAPDGCFTDGDVDVTVVTALIIPGAFTPNGDGQNDTWEVKNLEGLDFYDVVVFDGFGSEVFRSSSYRPWDGKFKGDDLSVGSYYYLITYELRGKSEVVTGVISILR